MTKEQIHRCIINDKFAGKTFYKMKVDINRLDITAKDAYLIYYDMSEPECYCGNKLKFRSFNVGFSSFCSNKCSNNDETVIRKQKENYNYKSAKIKSAITIAKRSPEENENIKKKIKQTKFENYGDENYNNRQQAKETCLEKYGVDNVQKVKEINNRTIATQTERYGGVFNPEKVKRTNIERYGVEYPMQNKIIANEFSKNMSRKYNGTNLNRDGFVYIIESSDYIKIGVTNNIESRLKVLRKHYGDLKILKIFETNYTYELEKILHETYNKYNIILETGSGRTEWFTKDILTELII